MQNTVFTKFLKLNCLLFYLALPCLNALGGSTSSLNPCSTSKLSDIFEETLKITPTIPPQQQLSAVKFPEEINANVSIPEQVENSSEVPPDMTFCIELKAELLNPSVSVIFLNDRIEPTENQKLSILIPHSRNSPAETFSISIIDEAGSVQGESFQLLVPDHKKWVEQLQSQKVSEARQLLNRLTLQFYLGGSSLFYQQTGHQDYASPGLSLKADANFKWTPLLLSYANLAYAQAVYADNIGLQANTLSGNIGFALNTQPVQFFLGYSYSTFLTSNLASGYSNMIGLQLGAQYRIHLTEKDSAKISFLGTPFILGAPVQLSNSQIGFNFHASHSINLKWIKALNGELDLSQLTYSNVQTSILFRQISILFGISLL